MRGGASGGERRWLSHALWFIAIMLPMAAFTYGIGELSFGAYSPGQRLTVGGFPALAVIFALLCLGLVLACFEDFERRTTFLLRWMLFVVFTLVFIRYVLFYPIVLILVGLGDALYRAQPQLIIPTLATCVAAAPVGLALALGQQLVVRSAAGSALRWFLLHFAMTASAFALALSAAWIRVNYQPLTGVLLAAPALAYALFAPRPPPRPPPACAGACRSRC